MSAHDPLRDAEALRMDAALLRDEVLVEVREERARQDAKWGGIPGIERRDDHTYAAVISEEVGEVCKAWLERNVAALREELVQVAAVAVAWIEELDNGGSVPRAPWHEHLDAEDLAVMEPDRDE